MSPRQMYPEEWEKEYASLETTPSTNSPQTQPLPPLSYNSDKQMFYITVIVALIVLVVIIYIMERQRRGD